MQVVKLSELQAPKINPKDFCGHLKPDISIDNLKLEADVKAFKRKNGIQACVATANFTGHLLYEEIQLVMDKPHATFSGNAWGASFATGNAPGILVTSDINALISDTTHFGFKSTPVDISIFFYGNGTILGVFDGMCPSGKVSSGVGSGSWTN